MLFFIYDLNSTVNCLESPNKFALSLQVQGVMQQMQDKFKTMSDQIVSRLDDMGNRIDDLERNIADLMTQAGVEEK